MSKVICRTFVWALVLTIPVLAESRTESKQGSAPNYLALGDSLAFGFNPTLPTNTNVSNFKGYPAFIANQRGLRVTNASRIGETSKSFVTGSLSDALVIPYGVVLPPGYPQYPSPPYQPWTPPYPTLVVYAAGQSQLDFAVKFLAANSNTKLVTISIGGNELGLVQVQCTIDPKCDSQTLLGNAIKSVGTNLTTIVGGIRNAGYKGPIVMVNYYAFDYTDATTTFAFGLLNDTISRVAQAAPGGKVAVADAYNAFRIASLFTQGSACKAGLLVTLARDPHGVPTSCDTHPSQAGQLLLSAAVEYALLF